MASKADVQVAGLCETKSKHARDLLAWGCSSVGKVGHGVKETLSLAPTSHKLEMLADVHNPSI